MSPFLSTLLFASVATAQITTSVWGPWGGSDEQEDYSFQGSVVAAEGDAVTMAIAMSGDEYDGYTETITFHGSTAFEQIITTTDEFGDYEGDMTISYGCTKEGNKGACVYSTNGPVLWSSICAEYTESTDVVTSTDSFDQGVPDFCLTGSLLPESYAVASMSLRASQIQTYPVTVTAGEAKLGATAGATPTNSGASPTNSGGVSPTKTGTTSPTGGNSSSGPSTTPSASAPPAEQSTAAAAPMMTLAPALAGLGALIAAFL